MRLYIYELIRLWKTPGILFALAVACVTTVGVLNLKSKEMLAYVNPTEYREEFDKLDGMNLADAYAVYENKEYDMMDFSQEALLTKTVKGELLEQTAYEEYLRDITESAYRLTSVSIFADKNSFSYRNAMAVSDVYERLKGKIVIKAGPSKGVELWSENGVTGLIILLVLCSMINEIVLKDRETGQLNLLFTMDKGRTKHGVIKIGVIVTSAFSVTFVILVIAFVTSASIFGIGDIMRPIQSVVGLKGCTIETSVLGYMAVYYLMLSITTALISIIIFFIASFVSSSVMVYMTVTIVFGLESALYYLINDNSYLAFIKEFNLLSFLNCGRYLSSYGNISLFGYPFYRFLFVLLSLGLLLLILVPLSVKAYSTQTTVVVKKSRIRWGLFKKFVPKSTSVFGHEAYKLLICGGTIWIVLLFAFYQAESHTPIKEYFENEDAIYYKRFALKYEGPVNEEKIKQIEDERNRYKKIEEEMSKVLSDCPQELISDISMQYQNKLKPRIGLELLVIRLNQLRKNDGYILYDTGYRLLTFDRQAWKKEITMAITAGILLVLSLTYLFAGDDRLYIDRVTSVTLKGRHLLYLKKIILGSMVTLSIYCLNYLPYFIEILEIYGANGFLFPAQSVRNLENTIFEKCGFTVGGTVILFMLLKYLIMILEMLLLSLISKRLRSISRTIVTGLVVFVGPLLVVYVLC